MPTTAAAASVSLKSRSGLGRLLRYWREKRSLSQFALGLRAGVSSRHLSFIESGRSRPTREMVLRLAASLQVPLREQNALLEAAGFAHIHRESALTEPELKHARIAIELILRKQEPFPAVVMDRHWNILHANDSAQRFFSKLLGKTKSQGPANVVRMVFHPDFLRPYITNWPEVAASLVQRMWREAVGGVLDEKGELLLNEVLNYPGVADSLSISHEEAIGPLIPLRFRKGRLAMSFFSTVTTLGTPRDIALQELRIECFFPADAESERAARTAY